MELNDPGSFNAQRSGLMDDLVSIAKVLELLAHYKHVNANQFQGAGAHFCTGGRHEGHEQGTLVTLQEHSDVTRTI